MTEMRIMGSTTALRRILADEALAGIIPANKITGGDTKHIFDPDNDAEVAGARALFDSLKKKGYNAYAVKGKNGDKGELMREFDPSAGRMILAPAMQGG